MRTSSSSARAHWDEVYRRHGPDETSWYQAEPAVSLELIDLLGIRPEHSVIDVGGGASFLADRLLDRGFRDVTVLDLARQALSVACDRLGECAYDVTWIETDVRAWQPGRRYELWHDRAAFHFLTEPSERRHYIETLERALAPAGAVVIASFSPDGPETCSGLPVVRHDARDLAALLGPGFDLVAERREEHVTPRGKVQPFAWAAFRRVQSGKTLDEILAQARARIARLTPAQAQTAAREGALIVDIRSDLDRERDGIVPGSIHIPRTVLEWRLAPDSDWRNPHIDPGLVLILLCDHGFSSSLAAATLIELGLDAADVIGGFEAWREAGLPVVQPTRRRGPGEPPGTGPPEPP